MNQPTKIPATATILIGGESKRFGSPKWQAIIDGIKLIDRTWDLCEIFENRFVVGKEKPDSISYPFIKDELDLKAPINGIYTALKYSKTDWVFLLSCDLPLMTNEIIQSIWTAGNHDADALVPMVNEYFQPTCAFYHKRTLNQIPRRIEDGNLSLHGLSNSINTETVIMDEIEKEFTNMNTRGDYEKILLERK